ncbi:MAG: hypothetical protein ACOX8V_03735 [Thermoleophilia bacterium]
MRAELERRLGRPGEGVSGRTVEGALARIGVGFVSAIVVPLIIVVIIVPFVVPVVIVSVVVGLVLVVAAIVVIIRLNRAAAALIPIVVVIVVIIRISCARAAGGGRAVFIIRMVILLPWLGERGHGPDGGYRPDGFVVLSKVFVVPSKVYRRRRNYFNVPT